MKWKELCHLNRISLPTLEELDLKMKDVKAALAYQFKEEDVEKVCIIKYYYQIANKIKTTFFILLITINNLLCFYFTFVIMYYKKFNKIYIFFLDCSRKRTF